MFTPEKNKFQVNQSIMISVRVSRVRQVFTIFVIASDMVMRRSRCFHPTGEHWSTSLEFSLVRVQAASPNKDPPRPVVGDRSPKHPATATGCPWGHLTQPFDLYPGDAPLLEP